MKRQVVRATFIVLAGVLMFEVSGRTVMACRRKLWTRGWSASTRNRSGPGPGSRTASFRS